MNLPASAALELLTAFWVLQSAAALIKTRKARRLHLANRKFIDGGVVPKEIRRVALVIAVKGVSGNFERFMDFALGQKYPDHHVIFVTESEDDPAHAAVAARIAGRENARLVVAGKAQATGQKVHNQLAAFRLLEKEDRIIAFADGDLHGRADWLFCLALPLNQGQADLTTGYRWFIPENPSLPNRVVTIIGAAIEPLIGPNWRMCLWGGSMAMTREVFDGLKVAENLVGSVNDDARISQLARRSGKRMRYVRSVAAPSPVDFTWGSLFEFGRRQYFQLRIYQPMLWWMALLIPSVHLLSLATCATRMVKGEFWLAGYFAVAVALNLGRTKVRRAYLAERFPDGEATDLDRAVKGSWWLDPVVNLVHLLIIASSACGRAITWAGIRYRVTGPQKTEILRR
ncbi:MAG: glycosyltransferase family 2 protein [Verrucomicrobiota bacterium]